MNKIWRKQEREEGVKEMSYLDKNVEELITAKGKTYGSPEEFFKKVSEAWSAITGAEITPGKAVAMMIMFKSIRLYNSPNHKDSIDDIKGYAHIAEKILTITKNGKNKKD
jgi:hypothetical protein